MLVNMPFASFKQPSLALGLLKAKLAPLGLPVRALDATLLFAEMIGGAAYDLIASWRAEDLLGDRLFAATLSRHAARGDDEYEAHILGGGLAEHRVPYFGKMPLSGRLREELRVAQARAGELLDRCLVEVVTARPLVVGCTDMVHQQTASLALTERVKAALPDTVVVFGGASCRGEMGTQLLRSFPFIDAVSTGEGEDVLPELVRRLLAGEPLADIPGLLTPGSLLGSAQIDPSGGDRPVAAVVDLDALPLPDYGDYFARLAASPLRGTFAPRLPFETSRGCWWGEKCRCTFCGQASDTMTYRAKRPARALDELAELTSRHPTCPIFVTDEILAPAYFEEVVPQLQTRVPDLRVVYFEVRADLRKEQLRLLAESGVRRLEVGIESLSTPVLTLMRKGTTALQNVQLLKWGQELDVELIWNLLWGFPGEDEAEYRRMATVVPLLAHLQPPNAVGTFRLDRFSPIFEDPDGFGITDVRPYPAYEYVYDLPPEALRRLAYSFVFDYREPQPVERYTLPLAMRVAEWKEHHAQSRLAFAEEGERVVLFDSRPGSDAEEVTVLDGEHRLLYLACDGSRHVTQLAGELAAARGAAASVEEVHDLLTPLVEQGFTLRDGDAYLSLAVALPPRKRA